MAIPAFPIFASASEVLEGAVLDLLGDDWEEVSRGLVHRMAGALRKAAHHAGWGDRESALRAIESLLSLSAAELRPIRKPVGDKLLELLGYLRRTTFFCNTLLAPRYRS